MPIDPAFRRLVEAYLAAVLNSPAPQKGWKIPETTLAYPWIVRMFPDAGYILWVRDPRDCVLGRHLTDDLRRFGIDGPAVDGERRRRAVSWKYQYDIVKSTPRPARSLLLRFEDFVLDQEQSLARLEAFVGRPMARIPVRPEAVGRWRRDDGESFFDFLGPAMREYGYLPPAAGGEKDPETKQC